MQYWYYFSVNKTSYSFQISCNQLKKSFHHLNSYRAFVEFGYLRLKLHVNSSFFDSKNFTCSLENQPLIIIRVFRHLLF